MMAGVAVPASGPAPPASRPLKSALRKSSTLPRPPKRQVVIDEARNTYCEAATSYGPDLGCLTLPRSRRPNPSPLNEEAVRPGFAPVLGVGVGCTAGDSRVDGAPAPVRKCPSPQTLVTALLTDSLRTITPPDHDTHPHGRHPWRPNLPDLVPDGSAADDTAETGPTLDGTSATAEEKAVVGGDNPPELTAAVVAERSGKDSDQETCGKNDGSPPADKEPTDEATSQGSLPNRDDSEKMQPEPNSGGLTRVLLPQSSSEEDSKSATAAGSTATNDDQSILELDDDEGTNLDDPDPALLEVGAPETTHAEVASPPPVRPPLPVNYLTVPSTRSDGEQEQRIPSPTSSQEDSYSLDDIEAALELTASTDNLPAASAEERSSVQTPHTHSPDSGQVSDYSADSPDRDLLQHSKINQQPTLSLSSQPPVKSLPSYGAPPTAAQLSLVSQQTIPEEEEELAGFVAGQAARTERLRRRYAAGPRRPAQWHSDRYRPPAAAERWSWTGGPELPTPVSLPPFNTEQWIINYHPASQQSQQSQQLPMYSSLPRRPTQPRQQQPLYGTVSVEPATQRQLDQQQYHEWPQDQNQQQWPAQRPQQQQLYSSLPRRPVQTAQSRQQQQQQLQQLQRRLGGAPPPALTVGFPRPLPPHGWRSTERLSGGAGPAPPRRAGSHYSLYAGTERPQHDPHQEALYDQHQEAVYEPVYATQRPASHWHGWERSEPYMSLSQVPSAWRAPETRPPARSPQEHSAVAPPRGRSVQQSAPMWAPLPAASPAPSAVACRAEPPSGTAPTVTAVPCVAADPAVVTPGLTAEQRRPAVEAHV